MVPQKTKLCLQYSVSSSDNTCSMVTTRAHNPARSQGPPGSARPIIIGLLMLIVIPSACPADVPVRSLPYRVAVVDMFWNSDEASTQGDLIAADAADIDGDGQRDLFYHGDLVSLFLQTDGVIAVPLPIHCHQHAKQEILARLEEILLRYQTGEHFDAVMFCWESSTLISSFGDELDPARRSRYKDLVRRWGRTEESWRLTYEIILALERLSEAGILVVTIAGNSGPAWVNTYTFAEDVLVIGALEPDPDSEWATSNALIDDYAQSRYTIRLVGEPDRPAYGYDIDEDGIAEIPLGRSSTWYRRTGAPRESRRVLSGTSFAAPTALKQMVISRRR